MPIMDTVTAAADCLKSLCAVSRMKPDIINGSFTMPVIYRSCIFVLFQTFIVCLIPDLCEIDQPTSSIIKLAA